MNATEMAAGKAGLACQGIPSVLQTASTNSTGILFGVYTILAETKFCVVGRVVSAMPACKTLQTWGVSRLLSAAGSNTSYGSGIEINSF